MTVTALRINPETGLLEEIRTIDGSENNPFNDDYNLVAGADERRLTDPNFEPGTTNGLIHGPDPRALSNLLSGGARAEIEDTTSGISGWSYIFGQFVDHDISRTPTGGDDISMTLFGDPTAPDGSMINMTRAQVSENGTAINAVTGWLDASQIYGSDAETNASLRTSGGKMKTSEGNNLPIDEEGNFIAGDIRVMENPQLSAITTLFVREHNFQVDRLAELHPEWTDDQLYEQAKAITTGKLQNIIYDEFLPAIIGKDAIAKYEGYNANIDPRIMQEFANAAFRFGHSTVSNEQAKIDNFGNVMELQSLASAMQNDVAARLANGGMDALIRAPLSDGANSVDTGAVDGLRDTMFGPTTVFDLIAVDIQRQRDLGLGTLNETREALGLAAYTDFGQLTDDVALREDLVSVYGGDINNVDLFMGGLAEKHAPGSTMGETFTTIIAIQFQNLRDGDQYYWENQDFDQETSEMIGNTTFSHLIQRNTDTPNVQANSFAESQRRMSNVAPEDPEASQLVIGTDEAQGLIIGGPNNDTLVFGNGWEQVAFGDQGSDTFVVNGTGHNTTITDFNTTFDTIQYQGELFCGDETVQVRDGCNGAEILFNGNTMTLTGVTAPQITQGNLSFLDENAIVQHYNIV